MKRKTGGLPPMVWSPEMDAKLKRMAKAGKSGLEIAAEFRCSDKTIWRRLSKLGTSLSKLGGFKSHQHAAAASAKRHKTEPAPKPLSPPVKTFVDLDGLRIEKQTVYVQGLRNTGFAPYEVPISLAKLSFG